ncbi:MAG: hypothetical protein ABIC68_01005 [Candidatus Omnitrophota bacterium]
MKKKKTSKKKKIQHIPTFKKDIKEFLLSEEGKINKKDIAKMGISLAALSLMFKAEVAEAGHSSSIPHSSGNPSHTNAFKFTSSTSRGGHNSDMPHASHSSHASHGSHGSHGQW